MCAFQNLYEAEKNNHHPLSQKHTRFDTFESSLTWTMKTLLSTVNRFIKGNDPVQCSGTRFRTLAHTCPARAQVARRAEAPPTRRLVAAAGQGKTWRDRQVRARVEGGEAASLGPKRERRKTVAAGIREGRETEQQAGRGPRSGTASLVPRPPPAEPREEPGRGNLCSVPEKPGS